jgi:hypothetical protein
MNQPGFQPRITRRPAAAFAALVAVFFIGCDRNDQAKKDGPATQPAPPTAGDVRPTGGAVGAGAPAGSASPDARSPGAGDSTGAAPRDPGTRPANPQAGKPGETFVVEENPELTGRFGRLLVQFPDKSDAHANIRLFKAGEEEAQQSVYNKLSADLLGGVYDVEVSNVLVHGVELRPRHNTRVRVGALRIAANPGTSIKVLGADGKQAFSGYGKNTIGLPVGKYTVEVAGQGEEVTIKDNEIADF